MMRLMELVRRNMRVYLRDRGAVFFSLLSMLVVIVVMLFFLGDVNGQGIVELLSALPGRDAAADERNAAVLVLTWVAAGVVAINAATVTLAVYSAMIRDRSEGRLSALYTAPVSRTLIAASYIIAAWLCSVIICTLTLLLSQGYCIMKGAAPYPLSRHIALLGMIAVNSFCYAALMYAAAMLVRTDAAWGSFGTIVGTLVGFLGGIYLPIGQLGGVVAGVMKCLPVIYGSKMLRSVMTAQSEAALFAGVPEPIVAQYRLLMGVDLQVFGHNVSDAACAALLAALGAVLLAAGAALTARRCKADR